MKTQILLLVFIVCTLNVFSQTYSVKEAKGLDVGTKAPLFEAVDHNENPILLKDLINKGPVVLFFYRGVWCPYCNRHLYEVQSELPKLYEKGAQVIAVTPEKPEYINEMIENTGATFTIVYDKDYKIAKAYGVNFQPKQSQINYANNAKDANLVDAHNNEEINLPIPATYIIDKNGKITWRHFDPNFRKRASVDEIVKHLLVK